MRNTQIKQIKKIVEDTVSFNGLFWSSVILSYINFMFGQIGFGLMFFGLIFVIVLIFSGSKKEWIKKEC